MSDTIEIRYKSKSDKIKILEIRDIENLSTNTKLFSFLLKDYYRKIEIINDLKLEVLQNKIRNY